MPQQVKGYLNKELDPKQKTIQTPNIDAQGFRKTKNENPLTWEIGVTSYQVLVNLPMVGILAGTG